MAPTGSRSNCLSYFTIRLLALVGILFCFATIYKTVYPGDTSIPNILSYYGLAQPSPPPLTTTKTKAIISPMLAGTESNHKWINDLFPDWERHIFTVDDPRANETVSKNKGNEASVYLTYIIEHYFALPDYMVFVHGNRYEWHTDDRMFDNSQNIAQLRLDHLDDVGYASLRCHWVPGCPLEFEPDAGHDDGIWDFIGEYARAWELFFPGVPVPKRVAAPCCAQFATSRAQVLARPVADYERIRQWLWDTDIHSGRSGRVMEYMWHIIFGQEAVFCPDTAQCYCDKYGLCDLDCPNEGECRGRVWKVYYDTRVPEGWPEHGQGERGWPHDKWWESLAEDGSDERYHHEDEDEKEEDDISETAETKTVEGG